MRVGGNCQNTLKGGGTEKREGGTKILKKGGKLGQGVGALKRGRVDPPYELWTYNHGKKLSNEVL